MIKFFNKKFSTKNSNFSIEDKDLFDTKVFDVIDETNYSTNEKNYLTNWTNSKDKIFYKDNSSPKTGYNEMHNFYKDNSSSKTGYNEMHNFFDSRPNFKVKLESSVKKLSHEQNNDSPIQNEKVSNIDETNLSNMLVDSISNEYSLYQRIKILFYRSWDMYLQQMGNQSTFATSDWFFNWLNLIYTRFVNLIEYILLEIPGPVYLFFFAIWKKDFLGLLNGTLDFDRALFAKIVSTFLLALPKILKNFWPEFITFLINSLDIYFWSILGYILFNLILHNLFKYWKNMQRGNPTYDKFLNELNRGSTNAARLIKIMNWMRKAAYNIGKWLYNDRIGSFINNIISSTVNSLSRLIRWNGNQLNPYIANLRARLRAQRTSTRRSRTPSARPSPVSILNDNALSRNRRNRSQRRRLVWNNHINYINYDGTINRTGSIIPVRRSLNNIRNMNNDNSRRILAQRNARYRRYWIFVAQNRIFLYTHSRMRMNLSDFARGGNTHLTLHTRRIGGFRYRYVLIFQRNYSLRRSYLNRHAPQNNLLRNPAPVQPNAQRPGLLQRVGNAFGRLLRRLFR